MALLVVLASLFVAPEARAQRHGQRTDRARPVAPAHPPAQPVAPAPAAPAPQARFKDLPVNSTFFFLSDTNRAYPWIKITDTTARNTVNTNEATIAAMIPVVH